MASGPRRPCSWLREAGTRGRGSTARRDPQEPEPGRRAEEDALLVAEQRSAFFLPVEPVRAHRPLGPRKAGRIHRWAAALSTFPPPEWEQRRPRRRVRGGRAPW